MPCSVIIRFYEELNCFVKAYPPKKDIPFSFTGKRSVKDLIESFGVPHTEVDLILINGESAGFDYIVADGDRISVYPVFERMDIQGLSPLREKPLRNSRFVLDVHLGKLARSLRMLGFDCIYNLSLDDPELAALSVSEQRILLTRDRGLLKRKIVTHGLYVHSDDPEEQLKEIVSRLDLYGQMQPLTRCLRCNGLLEALEGDRLEDLKPQIPPKVLIWCREFSVCSSCGRIYWEGNHYDAMRKRIRGITLEGRKKNC